MIIWKRYFLQAASLKFDKGSHVLSSADFSPGYKYGKPGYRLSNLSGGNSGPSSCFVTTEEAKFVKAHGYLPDDGAKQGES